MDKRASLIQALQTEMKRAALGTYPACTTPSPVCGIMSSVRLINSHLRLNGSSRIGPLNSGGWMTFEGRPFRNKRQVEQKTTLDGHPYVSICAMEIGRARDDV
ncbi:hypothetical protein P9851_11745 [Geobacillus stearothermophilus]|nr:hypothetical protein [Geobacillus stearothermophilus]